MSRRRRLFSGAPTAEADVRPTLLGVVTLLFLLLFFLLGTSSGQKLAVIGLHVGSADGLAPLPHAGLVKSVRVEVRGDGEVTVRTEIQTTDISASSTTTEARTQPIPSRNGGVDRGALETALAAVHDADPAQRKATVLPEDAVQTSALMSVMDAVRGPESTRFPEITLQDLL